MRNIGYEVLGRGLSSWLKNHLAVERIPEFSSSELQQSHSQDVYSTNTTLICIFEKKKEKYFFKKRVNLLLLQPKYTLFAHLD